MIKKLLKQITIFLIISILAEVLIFNMEAIFSRLKDDATSLAYTTSFSNSDRFKDSEYYILEKGDEACIQLHGVRGKLDYLYLDIEFLNTSRKDSTANIEIYVSDEGNATPYGLPSTTVYSGNELTKYIRTYCYGEVTQLRFYISGDSALLIKINEIVYNANVPFNFSIIRLLVIFSLLMILWNIRPSSKLYNIPFSSINTKKGTVAVITICTINIIAFLLLVLLNEAFASPGWIHHQQYHNLAVSLSKGEVSITTGFEDLVSTMTNPYDTNVRHTILGSDSYDVWDMAFYDGKFYVYFGIVPVLIFYLPFYLLTKHAFPTCVGIFTMATLIIIGTFYLMRQLVARYFKKTPLMLYIILSLMVANGIGTIPILMRPDFYSLPIICAIAFTIWGLGLWFSAASEWQELQTNFSSSQGSAERTRLHSERAIIKKIAIGSLCMALTAGCRPQFLVGSFFIFFIFGKCIRNDFKDNRKRLLRLTIAATIPYVVVSAGLMYYNYIRFDSPFDFGANYNLTTNDMTKRGFNLGRLSDGIFQYLFQFPNLGMEFPYVFSTSFLSSYVGKTIKEAMFGGVFFTHIVLLVLPALRNVKNTLKEKGLFGFCILSITFAAIVVVADAQMAGLLSRYYSDFLWLLTIPAVMIILQLWEQCNTPLAKRTLILFVVVCGAYGLFMDLGIGLQATSLPTYDNKTYYMIKTLFP